MKYALLIYVREQEWADASPAERADMSTEYEKFVHMLVERGAIRGGEELDLTTAATTVRRQADEVLVTDGPFAETNEQLGGFFLVEAADLDEALGYARQVPARTVEVPCRHRHAH